MKPPKQAQCSSCGADILWAVTPTGNRMPLDPEPSKRVVLGRKTGQAHVMDTYVPHFSTCPDADEHRRKR